MQSRRRISLAVEFGKICVWILRMEMVRYCALNVQGWSYLKSPSSCMVTDSGGSKLSEAAMSEVDFLLGKTLIEAVIVNNGPRLEAGSMHVVFFSGHICYCVKRFEGKEKWIGNLTFYLVPCITCISTLSVSTIYVSQIWKPCLSCLECQYCLVPTFNVCCCGAAWCSRYAIY